ncbi:putative D-aminopeptidase [uncultured Alphaproteobacteria bacterium]|uniref:Putative D-aminopeptidase n=1 Tax=uncultured Alphaproteobacteria bacterium TaxID=91750 RepID=A0A212K370_9PROT|nr:putative D-aminopeptidase [uncultured Alphaproteobacteria bacterium]
MKVYICADIEGTAGVVSPQQCAAGNPEYERARLLMTEEINAAIAGAAEAGADDIVVNDAHGSMINLLPDRLDPRARAIQGKPKPFNMFAGLADGTAAILCTGFHAPAGDFGVLAHTTSSLSFRAVELDGRRMSEAALYGAYAGERGIPVAMIAGDDVCAAHCAEWFPLAERVTTKRALGNRAAESLHPAAARAAIHAAAARALARVRGIPPLRLETPRELVLDLTGTALADLIATIPGTDRLDPTRVRLPVASAADAVRWVNVAAAMAAALR